MKIKIPCTSFYGCPNVTNVEVNENQYKEWILRKKLIQDAMPDLDATTREVLISGLCPECQRLIFG